jgi:hypothetical protein
MTRTPAGEGSQVRICENGLGLSGCGGDNGSMGADGDGAGTGDAVPAGLADAVDELYALPPEEFTAVRNERAKAAKAAGDKDLSQAIGKLRKPSSAAWLLNQMARHHAGELDQFLAVGAALREAQAELDADQLRDLSRKRHQVVAAVARQARALARRLGNPVSDTVEGEVEQTLRAALADPAAAAAVAGGSLTRTLDYAGLGDTAVDLTGAVALTGAAPHRRAAREAPAEAGTDAEDGRRAERERAELERAEADAADREREAAEAAEELERTERRVEAAESRRAATEDRIAELERQLEAAREEHADAGRDVRAAGRERSRAAAHADSARVAADRAQARATRLRGRAGGVS